MKATTKDLRLHSKEILNAVRRGEEITITYRGKPAAVMTPIKDTRQRRLKDSSAYAIWKDNQDMNDVQRRVDELRQGRF